jgi:hypothetical protein
LLGGEFLGTAGDEQQTEREQYREYLNHSSTRTSVRVLHLPKAVRLFGTAPFLSIITPTLNPIYSFAVGRL